MTTSLYYILEETRAKRDGRPAAWQDQISFSLAENGAIVMTVPPNFSPTAVVEVYKEAREHYYPGRRSKPLLPKWQAFFVYAIRAGVDPDNFAGSCDVSKLVDDFNENEGWMITAEERRRISNTWKKTIKSIDKFLVPALQEPDRSPATIDQQLPAPLPLAFLP